MVVEKRMQIRMQAGAQGLLTTQSPLFIWSKRIFYNADE